MASLKTKSGAQPATKKSAQALQRRRAAVRKEALSHALDASRTVAARVKALSVVDVLEDVSVFSDVLDVLLDGETNPLPLRLAALECLQAASFREQQFAPYRRRYIAALRRVCKVSDLGLRSRVIGILVRDGDTRTIDQLLDGLRDPQRGLLPPEKALQLLVDSIHSGVYEVAKTIAATPPNQAARREALRILGGDTESTGYFADLLRNKSEPVEVRQLAATSLNQLAPDRLLAAARDLAMDEAEDTDIRSLGLTALANFGDLPALRSDAALQTSVDQLSAAQAYDGTHLKTAAASFKRLCGA